MKYLIIYAERTAEDFYNHRPIWVNELFEVPTIEKALNEVSYLKSQPIMGRRFKEIIPIPESPDDFIFDGDEFKPKFDLDEFIKETSRLATKINDEEAEKQRQQQLADQQKAQAAKEEQDRLDYERLKTKYGA